MKILSDMIVDSDVGAYDASTQNFLLSFPNLTFNQYVIAA